MAAHILGARHVVPIHFDAVHIAPFYVQVDDPSGTFRKEAEALDVAVTVLATGETLHDAGIGVDR